MDFFQPCDLDGAEAVGPHLRGDNIVSDGHAQALELDVFLRPVVAFDDEVHGLRAGAGPSP